MNIDQIFLTFSNHWNIWNLRVSPSDINPGVFNFTEVTMGAVTKKILKLWILRYFYNNWQVLYILLILNMKFSVNWTQSQSPDE